MMIVLASEIQKSMTRPRRSVHRTSLRWALCQALVRSTTQRWPRDLGLTGQGFGSRGRLDHPAYSHDWGARC